MLGQNCQMFVSMTMRENKTSWDKTAIFLSVWRQKKTPNQRTKLSIYILDTIESESTTRFKNRSSDRMLTSDWLVDFSDDRYTTSTLVSSTNKTNCHNKPNQNQTINCYTGLYVHIQQCKQLCEIGCYQLCPLNLHACTCVCSILSIKYLLIYHPFNKS